MCVFDMFEICVVLMYWGKQIRKLRKIAIVTTSAEWLISSHKWGKARLCSCSNPIQLCWLMPSVREENVGIEFRSRTDGGFYKPQRLRTQSKVMLDILRDLLFADDCALCASSAGDMQRMVDLFAEACANFGLIISIIKTEVMFQPAPGEPYVEPHITINGQRLKVTDKFPYLGSPPSRCKFWKSDFFMLERVRI